MTVSGNLRAPASSLLGRGEDLVRLSALFSADGAVRVVTLVGPPGVGKTRLALELGARERQAYAEVWSCDVSTAQTAWDVARAVAVVLGLPPVTDEGEDLAIERVGDALQQRGALLLLLDNVEQVIGPAARVVSRWRETAADARFLVTSREPLAIAGEVLHAVEPLDGASSAELFVARASALMPTFAAAAAEEADAIREIVRRLDGLPLAIELAATRIQVLRPSALLPLLSRQLDLLRSTDRDRPERQMSLRAALAWSWALLEPVARETLCRLSIFDGGFTVDAAGAVLEATSPADALDRIQSLRRRSLLMDDLAPRPRGEPRFILATSVREFAREAAGDARTIEHVARLHARHYAALVEEASRAEIGADLDNMMAAHRRCLDSMPALAARIVLRIESVFSTCRPVDERLAMLDKTLEALASAATNEDHVALLCARAEASATAGRIAPALDDALRVIVLAEEMGAWELAARAHRITAHLFVYEERWEEGLAHADRALHAAERAGSTRERIRAHRLLGFLAAKGQRVDDARTHLDEALLSAIATADRDEEALVLNGLAELEEAVGHPDQTTALRRRALAIHRSAGDRAAEALALLNLSYAAMDGGEWQTADGLASEARSIFRELGHRRLETIALVCLSCALGRRRRFEDAMECAHAARVCASGAGHYAVVLATLSVGVVEASSGALEASRAAFDAVRGLLQAAPSAGLSAVLGVLEGFHDLALARAAAGRGEEAESQRHVDAARDRWKPDAPDAREAPDLRVVRRVLRDELDTWGPTGASDAKLDPATLRVEGTGRWFERAGARTALAQRPVVRRLLVELARQRVARPGSPVSFRSLIAAGWPDERILPEAAARRLHVTISRLRDLGLRDVLRRDPDGYLLDDGAPVSIVEDDDRL